MTVNAGVEQLVKQLDVALESNPLAHFVQMFLSHLRLELRIVEQQSKRKLSALLYQVDLGHPFGFALELFGGNADQVRPARSPESLKVRKRLIEIAGEKCNASRVYLP